MRKVISRAHQALWFGSALSCIAPMAQANEETTVIRVESSTIGDRFENKRQEPSNIAAISGEEVDKAHSENIQQLLQSIPGITTEVQSGDSVKIHIRGVENQRYMGEKPGVAVVIDGVPVFERTGRVNIDLDNIESIKVVKGGASYLFGEDALAGAVIITTKRGAKMAGYKVETEVGSFGYRKGLARAGFASENANGHLQISQRQSDGYHYDSDYKAAYLNGKWQYYLDDVSDITVGMEISDREKDSHGTVEGVTQAENDPESVEGRDYTRLYDVALQKWFITYGRDLNDDLNLSLNTYQFTDHTQFVSAPQNYDASGVPVTDVDAYTTGNDYHQRQQGIKGELRRSGEGLAWMGGIDLRDNRYDNDSETLVDYKTSPSPFSPVINAGTVTSDDITDERVYALYGELKGAVNQQWVLTGNYRYDHISLDYHDNLQQLDLDKQFKVSSWRGGFNYQLAKKRDLYGNVSTGFRTPTISQLFSGDTSPTGSTESNPDLKPEKSLNIELGLRGEFNDALTRWDYDVAIFRIIRDDFIISTSGQYAIPDSGETDRYENIGGVENRGLELSLRSDTNKPISVDIAYTFLDARFTDYDNFNLILGNRYRNPTIEHYDNTGNIVPRTPRHHLNIKLTGRISPAFSLTGEMETISSYYADELNRFHIGGHSVYNLLANYEMESKGVEWSLFLRIDNLFNRTYYNTARSSADRNADGVYDEEDLSLTVNPGRVYTAGVSAKF